MLRKKLFYFTLVLNGLFYFAIALMFYGVQNQLHRQEVLGYFDKMAKVVDDEMRDRGQFYQRWYEQLLQIPQNNKSQQDLLLNTYQISYLGKLSEGRLAPLAPLGKAPPFTPEILAANTRFLFFRDAKNLFFTYTMSSKVPATPPQVVVQKENTSYFLNRARAIGAQVIVIEKENSLKSSALYSTLKEAQTKDFEDVFNFVVNDSALYKLGGEPFYVISIPLHASEKFQQTLALAFSLKSFDFYATFGMTIFLLACFCASLGLLYFGYLKSRPKSDL